MSPVSFCIACSLLVPALLLAAAGCGSAAVGPFGWPPADRLEDDRLEAQHRERFQEHGDPESLRWLLTHRLAAGMSLTDVSHVLGEEGERLYDAGRLKRGDSLYRENDDFYKWGPASDGRSVYLAFRDGRLLHYDPQEFAGE
ncbi:MAG TPA: hypothetical protein VML55_26025 [Planctomycetaceae bacterium]|nr:hypothetical protein [Planctomycetaceae bacterium]